MKVLPQVETIQYLLLENVCGFERSESRDLVRQSLSSVGFSIQEFLICPRQIGIPNSRLRYYLLARKDGINLDCSFKINENFSPLQESIEVLNINTSTRHLSEYLDCDAGDDNLVPDEVLAKHAKVLDIVRPDSDVSCCFTSGYHRYCEGTGSVLQTQGDLPQFHEAYKQFGDTKDVGSLHDLRLRYFTSSEVARLLGFPSSFSFPNTVTAKQKYKVLGNSLNVTVVSILLHNLIKDLQN